MTPNFDKHVSCCYFAGCLYVWGDCDLEEGRCVAPPTHVHIIKLAGASLDPPPSYNSATAPAGPQYPQQGAGNPPPYPQAVGNHDDNNYKNHHKNNNIIVTINVSERPARLSAATGTAARLSTGSSGVLKCRFCEYHCFHFDNPVEYYSEVV